MSAQRTLNPVSEEQLKRIAQCEWDCLTLIVKNVTPDSRQSRSMAVDVSMLPAVAACIQSCRVKYHICK